MYMEIFRQSKLPHFLVNYLNKSGVGSWYLKILCMVDKVREGAVLLLVCNGLNLMHSGQKGGTDTHNATMIVTSETYCKKPKYYNKTVLQHIKCLCYCYNMTIKLRHHSVFPMM